MKTVSLKLPDELHAKLTLLSRRRSMGKSEVVRAALEAYFAENQSGGQSSCADLAGDLIGCLSGPNDLASNPRHLQGYGQ
jgi:Arc/MetJ-type ribon-helix-helix transcriptional regulator